MRSFRKKLWWRLAAGLFGAVVLVIVFLPMAVGSRWIYEPLVNRLAADDFHLRIGSVRMRWLSPLLLRDVQIRQQGGPALITISEVRTDRGLLGYLLAGRRLDRIEIIQPELNVELLKEGSNLQRFVKAVDNATKNAEPSQSSNQSIDIRVDVRNLTARVTRQTESGALFSIAPVNLNMNYQAADGVSHLRIAPTTVLDHATLTPALVELGLDYAVPLLASSAWFDGEVSLTVGAIDIPLEQPRQMTGQMQLTLHQVRSGPTAPAVIKMLDLVAAMRGATPQHELVFVDDSQVAITIGNARVHHSGLLMGLPKMDTRLQLETSGYVGLEDRGLDLLVKVPVPLEQLARREQVQELGVPILGVPIGGTLDDPSVRWDALRGDAGQLLALMRTQVADESPATAAILGTLGGLAEGKADQAIVSAFELVQQFRERRRLAGESSQEESSAAKRSANTTDEQTDPLSESAEKRRQPIRDGIRNLFRRPEEN